MLQEEETVQLTPNPNRPRRRRTERRHKGVRLAPAPNRGLRLQSVPKAIQCTRARVAAKLSHANARISRERKTWTSKRFKERVQITRGIAKLVPRGTVGNQWLDQLPAECSTCDERTKLRRPAAAAFAARRLRKRRELSGAPTSSQGKLLIAQKPKKKKTKPFPELTKETTQEESEEEPVPPFDDADFGDGSGDDADKPGPGAAASSIAADAAH